MLKLFTRDGIAFQYPGNWSLETEEDDGGWTASISSPGTAFFVVSLRPDNQTPAQVVDEALDAMKAEYKELEAEPVVESVGGFPAVGHNIDFLTLDTAINAWSRCTGLTEGNLLIFAQVSELDRRLYDQVLRAMLGSFAIADGDV